jgi:hypothetical protein
VLVVLGLATLVVAGCDSASKPASFTSQDVRAAFQDHGVSITRPPLPFPPNGQEVLSPELDGSFAPYQIWVLRSGDEAGRYKELFESGNYAGMVEDNPEYRVERTVLNGNVLLVVFRGSRGGDDAAAIVNGLD